MHIFREGSELILVARAYVKTDVVKIGRKGKRVKMARW
jgi:hypothetical protein